MHIRGGSDVNHEAVRIPILEQVTIFSKHQLSKSIKHVYDVIVYDVKYDNTKIIGIGVNGKSIIPS